MYSQRAAAIHEGIAFHLSGQHSLALQKLRAERDRRNHAFGRAEANLASSTRRPKSGLDRSRATCYSPRNRKKVRVGWEAHSSAQGETTNWTMKTSARSEEKFRKRWPRKHKFQMRPYFLRFSRRVLRLIPSMSAACPIL